MRREPSKRTSVRDARSARPNARERGPRRPLLCAAIYMLRHAVCGHRERGKDGTQVADLSRGASQAGLWSAILGALTKTTPGIEEIVGDQGARTGRRASLPADLRACRRASAHPARFRATRIIAQGPRRHHPVTRLEARRDPLTDVLVVTQFELSSRSSRSSRSNAR